MNAIVFIRRRGQMDCQSTPISDRGKIDMFCNQCEQAAKGVACTSIGVCGKPDTTAGLQDILSLQLEGIGYCAHRLRQRGIVDAGADRFTLEGLFTTVTNVNFDDERISGLIAESQKLKIGLIGKLKTADPSAAETQPRAVSFMPATNAAGLHAQAAQATLAADEPEDVRSVRQLLRYGLRGLAAYADHALILGRADDAVTAFIYEALAALADPAQSVESLVALSLKCGTVNLRCMELLDAGHTGRFGHPVPTTVSTGRKPGPAIIISGHDLVDLEALLEQTEGTGVNIYTHGEMLPAHGYPGLKKFPHLAGHFGTAWQNQREEFDDLPAAILFTTNCIQKPRESYFDRVFTTGLVGWPGVRHAPRGDFSAVIARAKELGGFEAVARGTLTTGFGHQAVLEAADKIVAAVKSGAIKHFFLIGGCDGAKPGRNYYTELAEQAPADTVILTLACGKFRFNHLDLGTVAGLPRLLDLGQCNDAHSAVKIALALAEAFGCGVNDLPLSLVLSWYEQKAVVILLSLLSLGIKGIRLGPTLPAFITPNILDYLVRQFGIKPIGTAREDLAEMLAR
jgi:hydroxylamine reductase